jgi:hypothetical protein
VFADAIAEPEPIWDTATFRPASQAVIATTSSSFQFCSRDTTRDVIHEIIAKSAEMIAAGGRAADGDTPFPAEESRTGRIGLND